MNACEIERRFKMAVARWRREVAHRGMCSEGAGPVRTFDCKNIYSDGLVRSLEGAVARCYGVPVLGVASKDGFHFDKDAFGAVVDRQRYIEADYIGISENYLIVAVAIRSVNTLEIVIRAIPLYAILGINVLYEEDAGRKRAA